MTYDEWQKHAGEMIAKGTEGNMAKRFMKHQWPVVAPNRESCLPASWNRSGNK